MQRVACLPRIATISFLILLSGCRAVGIEELNAHAAKKSSLSNPLTIVTWNTQKKSGPALRQELDSFIRGGSPDLVLLQEYSDRLADQANMRGIFASSWHYPWPDGETIGVTTLALVSPAATRPLPTRYREFFVTAPKTSLLTEYPLRGGGSVLVANVHLLTFERWGTMKLRSQLADLEAAIVEHDGPVIVAGDFNTWNRKRLDLVATAMRRLGLEEATGFDDARRKTGDFGPGFLNWLFGVNADLPLDRVYYRGLDLQSTSVLPSRVSDHHALRVDFTVPANTVDPPPTAKAQPSSSPETATAPSLLMVDG